MSLRAGVVVTGTEVLTGRISDRNGPWLAEHLLELGIEIAHIAVVGDRPEDIEAALRFFRDEGMDLIVTSGGLGPTADDLTAEVVAAFQGRPPQLDEALEARIWAILERLRARWPEIDEDSLRASNRKQAMVPVGATVLAPAGTAPGLVVPPLEGTAPTVVVLPGPPRELQPLWRLAVDTDAFRAATRGRADYRQATLRLFGIPESEIAATLIASEQAHGLEGLEITTCMRRSEIEVVTRFEPEAEATYDAFVATVRRRHRAELFSDDGRSVDAIVADGLRRRGWSIATAESCTGGLVAARLTELPGASDYVAGGLIVYADVAKVELAGVERALIEQFGAVSHEVAEALAHGARARLDADVGIGVTGIAGPGGGSEDKPVGLVWLVVAGPDGAVRSERMLMPGSRADVRDRTTTFALHLVRDLVEGS